MMKQFKSLVCWIVKGTILGEDCFQLPVENYEMKTQPKTENINCNNSLKLWWKKNHEMFFAGSLF